MPTRLTAHDVHAAIAAIAREWIVNADALNELDAALGDGDTGVTIRVGAQAMLTKLSQMPEADVATLFMETGMAFNRAAASTIGALVTTAGIHASKQIKAMGITELDLSALAALVATIEQAIVTRGKAKHGDKTLLDALIPARESLEQSAREGLDMKEAGFRALTAAMAGRDATKSLRSKVGRAGWVGERTIGHIDPGAEIIVLAIQAVVGVPSPDALLPGKD